MLELSSSSVAPLYVLPLTVTPFSSTRTGPIVSTSSLEDGEGFGLLVAPDGLGSEGAFAAAAAVAAAPGDGVDLACVRDGVMLTLIGALPTPGFPPKLVMIALTTTRSMP